MGSSRQIRAWLWGYVRPHVGILSGAFGAMLVLGLSTAALAFLTGPVLRFLLLGGEDSQSAIKVLPWVEALIPRGAWSVSLAIAFIAALKGVAYLGQFFLSGWFGQRVVADLRRDFFSKLLSISPVQLTRQRTGDLLSRFSADIAAVELGASYGFPSYLRDGLQILVLVIWSITLNARLALSTLGLAALAILPAARLTRIVLRHTRQALGELGGLGAQIREGLGAIRTIQAFDAYGAEKARFESQTRAYRKAVARAALARMAVPGLMEVLGALAISLVIAWAGEGKGGARPEEVVSFLVALVLLYQPAKEIGRSTQFLQQAFAASERLWEVLSWEHPVEEVGDAPHLAQTRKELRFEKVRFSYGDKPALKDLSLTFPVGQTTALVGASGAGKSTIASLLLRFEKPSSGCFTIDGVDVSSYSASSVRRLFSLVTQEPLLFSDTLKENIRFSRADASDGDVVEATRVAQIHEVIDGLPKGFDTLLSERGLNLSGGQRQRICLARALLAKRSVLVLDEATSSLDPENEAELQRALEPALRGRTAIVIAHRLSTVMRAHRIHVLDDGCVVESGTHEELLAKEGTYAHLWALQQGKASSPQVCRG